MIKVFSHINELREDGWRQVRALIAAFDHVTLWGPSFAYVERLAAEDPISMDGRELLEHIGLGRVTVMARHWWLTDRARREARARDGGWPGYAWHDLDDELQKIYLADEGKPDARVMAFEEGADIDTVQRLIKERNLDPLAIATRATAELPGYMDKARGDLRVAGVSLIKDAYNHGDVFGRSGADRTFGVPRDQFLYEVFAEQAGGNARTELAMGDGRTPDLAVFLEGLVPLIDRIQSIGPPPADRRAARGRLDKLLGDEAAVAQLRLLVEQADALIAAGVVSREAVLLDLLRARLEEAFHARWSTRLRDVVGRLNLRHVAGFGLSFLAKYLGSQKLTTVSEDLVRQGALLRARRCLPAGYEGPVWPVYVAVDERDPGQDAHIMYELLRLLRASG